MLEEIYKLTQENNRLLRKMHRHALWGRIFTIVFYAALLIAPIWFYLTYLNGTVQQLLTAYQKMEGVTSQGENQFQQIQDAVKQLQAKLLNMSATSTQQH